MHKQLVREPMLVVSLGEHAVNQEVVVKWVSSLCWFLRDNPVQPHFFNYLVFNASHEFLNADLKQVEYIIWLYLGVEVSTIFESVLDLKQLLQVLVDIKSVVDAVEAKLKILLQLTLLC